MADFSLRCPRCKESFSSQDADELADALLAHTAEQHGHSPPREHVIARIERHSRDGG